MIGDTIIIILTYITRATPFRPKDEKPLEVWRVSYSQTAYKDQTGSWQAGHVVFEQVVLTDTGDREDMDDGYGSLHLGHARIYASSTGRRFKVWSELVDYAGGTHVVPEVSPKMVESWKVKPESFERHIQSSGEVVTPLIAKE